MRLVAIDMPTMIYTRYTHQTGAGYVALRRSQSDVCIPMGCV